MPDIYFTTVETANNLIAEDSYALIVGLTLYQQVPTEKAFGSPAVLKERLGGTLDVNAVASMDPEMLTKIFQQQPALHRFPANMAKRTQAVSQFIVDEYDGDTERIWTEASNADDLIKRLTAIPGFGDYKARLTLGVLAKHYGVKPRGFTKYMPDWPSIVDISKPEDLAKLKARKKAWKASKA